MTNAERRERARLRSERWRRAHGNAAQARTKAVAGHGHQPQHLVPPTLKARQQAALAQATAAREAVLDRLQWQLAELRASLERAAVAHEAMRAELAASICDFVTFRN
jgi:hypothetical protein